MFTKINYFFFLFLLLCCSVHAQQTPAELIARKIADKMTDSLLLSSSQHDTLYAINMQLHKWKMVARQQHGSPDSLQYYLQHVENMRDSLYLPVLGEDKFLLYRTKKTNLVNNN